MAAGSFGQSGPGAQAPVHNDHYKCRRINGLSAIVVFWIDCAGRNRKDRPNSLTPDRTTCKIHLTGLPFETPQLEAYTTCDREGGRNIGRLPKARWHAIWSNTNPFNTFVETLPSAFLRNPSLQVLPFYQAVFSQHIHH